MRSIVTSLGAAIILLACLKSASGYGAEIIVSVPDQEMALIARGKTIARFPVSTSKFGIGDGVGTYRTPLGVMYVSGKVGDGLPAGAVIKSRIPTGEVIAPNAPGRDPIVSRVLWLRGKEDQNRNARDRCIYIHGTAEERMIGRRASYGCIRMKSADVTALYRQLPVGAVVKVVTDRLPRVPKAKVIYEYKAPDAPTEVGRPAPLVNSQESSGLGEKNAASQTRRNDRT